MGIGCWSVLSRRASTDRNSYSYTDSHGDEHADKYVHSIEHGYAYGYGASAYFDNDAFVHADCYQYSDQDIHSHDDVHAIQHVYAIEHSYGDIYSNEASFVDCDEHGNCHEYSNGYKHSDEDFDSDSNVYRHEHTDEDEYPHCTRYPANPDGYEYVYPVEHSNEDIHADTYSNVDAFVDSDEFPYGYTFVYAKGAYAATDVYDYKHTNKDLHACQHVHEHAYDVANGTYANPDVDSFSHTDRDTNADEYANALMSLETLTTLLRSVLRSSPASAREADTSLLTEVRRLPSFWNLAWAESDVPLMRVVYRTSVDDPSFGIMDLYRQNRFEGTAEAFQKLQLRDKFGFDWFEQERFVDFAWNFPWVLANMRTKKWTQDLSLRRILESVDLVINDAVISET